MLPDQPRTFRRRAPGRFEAQRDVLLHGQPRHQPVFLKHDAAFESGRTDWPVVEQNLPVMVAVQPDDQPEDRRFAATGGSNEADEFPRLDHKIDPLQDIK